MVITLYLMEDRPTYSVVRYSDGGDALEWHHDLPLRGAIEAAAELIRLHGTCKVEVEVHQGHQVLRRFC
jgi:hypothetical protein